MAATAGFLASSFQITEYIARFFSRPNYEFSERFLTFDIPHLQAAPTGDVNDFYDYLSEEMLILPSRMLVAKSGFLEKAFEERLEFLPTFPKTLCDAGWTCGNPGASIHFFGITNTGDIAIPSLEFTGPIFGPGDSAAVISPNLSELHLIEFAIDEIDRDFNTCLVDMISSKYGATSDGDPYATCRLTPLGKETISTDRPLLPGETLLFATGIEYEMYNYVGVIDWDKQSGIRDMFIFSEFMWPYMLSIGNGPEKRVRRPDNIGAIVAPGFREKG